ncbi:sigma-70 family RNA polymerase sigma factor [Lentzea sp. BCCO 10_0856]|uniref:Sigma-70 family RNA polymerase sigma factor n=1 Tax=Lentzea miocenica TaxID=3095431 RepID=A0ABU4SZ48_9PSEU|nr:sigma-70 family RNA polymerase sigma factor [Lentzea sp. BCCO 10_0856]MDX8031089.1 sigma-70 family RNA polymerase sigma factor [Lentzea sp. BCCO 10_0856]
MRTPEPDQGPDQGFAEFFRTCLPVVTRTLTALTGDTRVVDDVAQDALVIAQHRWGDIHAYDKPEAWVLKVAIRLMRRWQQKYQHETPLVSMPEVVERVREVEALHSAVRQLSPRHREAVALHHLLGYSVSEIASVLVVSESTVRTHLSRGRAELRRILGGSDE